VSATLNAILPSLTPPTLPAADAPLFALAFGKSNLITNSYRVGYLCDALANPDGIVPALLGLPGFPSTGLPAMSPQHQLRKDLKINDLRNFVPQTFVLLCGGNADPSVYYALNTSVMQQFWTPQLAAPQLLTVLDVDSNPTGATDPFAAVKVGFATAKAAVIAGAIKQGVDPTLAVAVFYHGTLVPPFCGAAHRGFFSQF
jgi:hypothetical protein